jgi:hypothetical protein
MSVTVKKIDDITLNFEDIVRRSPDANTPKALEHLVNFTNKSTYTYVGLSDGNVACIYGLMQPTLLSNRVYLWLMTTDIVEEHKFTFIRHSQRAIERILHDFDMIIGDASEKDARATKWLGWLGAKFLFSRKGMHPFYITRESFEGRRKR